MSSFQQIGQITYQGEPRSVFKARLSPFLWRLTLNYQSRIFQSKSVPQIIETVLEDAGFQADDYRFSLQSTYEILDSPPREFCVQYRESDFNFISRLMEMEGIFYFFEYDSGKDVMVISDHYSVHSETAPLSTVGFSDLHGLHLPHDEFIHELQYKESVLPDRFELKDFNYESAHTSLMAISENGAGGSFTVYDYPGHFGLADQGLKLAIIRNEESETGRRVISGKGNCRSFCAGFRFTLTDHYTSDLNREYLLIGVRHHGLEESYVPCSFRSDKSKLPQIATQSLDQLRALAHKKIS